MDSSQYATIFKIAIIAIVYIIIFVALMIIYKDIKNGGRKKVVRRALGLEIIEPGDNSNLKKGGVIPIGVLLTVGRKEDNRLVLADRYVSGHHARIYVKNNEYILEDLNSTNGVFLNYNRLQEKCHIKAGDEIKIGSSLFKVI